MKKALVKKGLVGDCSGLVGDCSGLVGDCSGLVGDCSGLRGDCSGLRGDFDACEITETDRATGVSLADLFTDEESKTCQP